MGCEQFEEPTIRRLYNFGYRSVETILESHVAEFQKLLPCLSRPHGVFPKG